jgi:hypothetical protein
MHFRQRPALAILQALPPFYECSDHSRFLLRPPAHFPFFLKLEKVSKFTQQQFTQVKIDLEQLSAKVANVDPNKVKEKDALTEEAQRIGNNFLQLEKYVNLNYMVRDRA